MHLTLSFDAPPAGAGMADADLADAALRRGVKAQPLSWHSQRPYQPGLVLGYAASTPAEIHDGVAIIGNALRHELR